MIRTATIIILAVCVYALMLYAISVRGTVAIQRDEIGHLQDVVDHQQEQMNTLRFNLEKAQAKLDAIRKLFKERIVKKNSMSHGKQRGPGVFAPSTLRQIEIQTAKEIFSGNSRDPFVEYKSKNKGE